MRASSASRNCSFLSTTEMVPGSRRGKGSTTTTSSEHPGSPQANCKPGTTPILPSNQPQQPTTAVVPRYARFAAGSGWAAALGAK
jgi:hypothetical protein